MKILVMLNVRKEKQISIDYFGWMNWFLVERIFDGMRYSRRIPSEESAHMALFARTELNRNPERKVIGLS